MDFPFVTYLIRNPWGGPSGIINDGMLARYLHKAGVAGQDLILDWVAKGLIEDGRDSFAAVLYDPTRPQWATTPKEMVFAMILYGPNAKEYIPNGGSKADGHDLHGMNMGEIVEKYPHLLGTGAFAWGDSAMYKNAPGGGSGLSVIQDKEVVKTILKSYVDDVIDKLSSYVEGQRAAHPHTGWRWFSADNEPAQRYAELAELIDSPALIVAEDGGIRDPRLTPIPFAEESTNSPSPGPYSGTGGGPAPDWMAQTPPSGAPEVPVGTSGGGMIHGPRSIAPGAIRSGNA